MSVNARIGNIGALAFKGGSVVEDIRAKYGFDGDLLRIFSQNEGEVVHKWHHYIPLYDRYFAKFRGKPVKFLEIGVSKGGSLKMWRQYFGPEAKLYGIDIDPACARFDGQAGQVRIGSQDDTAFLASVVAEMGGVDVVLDDGSHVMAHVRATLAALFPVLSTGGVYMIEDLHTAFWKKWGGGYGVAANVFADLGLIIDDMHIPYHGHAARMPKVGPQVSGLHVHDSIIVLEKDAVFAPVHSQVG